MKNIIGTHNRVLEVDLKYKSQHAFEISKTDRTLYLGAKGLGLKLLFDRMHPGVDPLGPDNMIAFMPGVLMGTGGPCSGRFEAVTKSPLTGIMISSSCGGPFGMALKTAGWDGLILKGCAEKPVFLDIDKFGAEFKDAGSLWGREIPDVQAELDEKKAKSVVIGPAGENRVRFANIASGHRFLGRGGIGAVMGSKNLKAIRAQGGEFRIKPAEPILFNKTRKKAFQYIKQNRITGDKYNKYGTAANVMPCLDAGILPVNNFNDGRHDKAVQVSGETMAQKHATTHHTCKPCTIQCGHKGTFKAGTLSAPEFETIGLLGTSLGIFDLDIIAELNQVCGRLGIDTISAGGTIAWVMEAAQKGLINSDLKFGSADGIIEALNDMAYMKGFGAKMAMGTRALSKEFGGQEFAIQVKGLELSAYDPRGSFGQGLAFAVANRGGCHLSAYLIAQEIYFNLLKADTNNNKAVWVKFIEDLTCCINSLQTCHFTMYAIVLETPLARYTPDLILGTLMQHLPRLATALVDFSIYTNLWKSVTGIPISNREFLDAGERVHVLERYMNTREGIARKDDTLPGRLLSQGRKSDPENKTVTLEDMISEYYRLRGYDENGIPTESLLKKLKIKIK